MKPSHPAETIHSNVRALIARGVVVHNPPSVFIDDDVDPLRFAPGVVIHPGCRVSGTKTSIGPGCVLGEEAPATVRDCRLGRDVSLAGGSFAGSTFLDGAKVGSSAHVRPGTLLEEAASAAHCVGFKQTILLPFVTVGSLANFCDCLMAGGTGAKNHGEVGSSYIHFNFTPNQDKATASLLGDVPRGVMLDQPPVFLGGQGGLVGPSRLAFGTVVAAGVVCRQDILEEGLLYTGRSGGDGRARKFRAGSYVGAGRLLLNNLIYIGNVRALYAWYRTARCRLMSGDSYQEACCEGAMACLELALDERLRRLREVAERLAPELAAAHARLRAEWPRLWRDTVTGASTVGLEHRDKFLESWERIESLTPYPEAVVSLDASAKAAGRAWLQAIVDEIVAFLPLSHGVSEDGKG